MHILIVLGTRPEAIKLAPVIRAFRRHRGVRVTVCSTGQHREMLDQVFEIFDVRPDCDLGVMARVRGLSGIAAEVLKGFDQVLAETRPDWVLVHGDTTTTMAAALSAFHRRVPVGHVEAGLRTYDLDAPFPEEMNRQVVSRVASIHFAPTTLARSNLLRDGVSPERIVVTGNTVIDALLSIVGGPMADKPSSPAVLSALGNLDVTRRMVLLTGHRRENQGGGLASVFRAVRRVVAERDVTVAFPVHLSPAVRAAARDAFQGEPRVALLPPVDYVTMVWLMRRSHFIITDSGGIQEEAPTLGRPVLVTRQMTERPEAVEAGAAKLVGTSETMILRESLRLLDDESYYRYVASTPNPFGDGLASQRICESVLGRSTVAA